LTPSTRALPCSPSTLSTRARVPRSAPEITSTVSPLRICISHQLARQADDLHVVLVAQLAGHRAENARAARIVVVVDDHSRVAVEPDVAAVVQSRRLARADDHRPHDRLLLDFAPRNLALDAANDHVPEARHAPPAPSQDLDAHHFLGAGVV